MFELCKYITVIRIYIYTLHAQKFYHNNGKIYVVTLMYSGS